MHKNLDEARVEAVKSATEIINSISKHLVLKDLDLLLIDSLMTPRSLSFYSITDDWTDRDYRQVGMIYGGALAILALILLSIGAFHYLPMLLVAIVAGRYFYLRHQLTKMVRSRPVHLQTLKIARYLVLHAQLAKKKSLFKDMSVKYTMLKYIRDKRTITGADYLKMFTHIDDEVDFYRLLHGVIDDVLLYAVAQETSIIPEGDDQNAQNQENDQEDGFHHNSEPQEILQTPPERTSRDVASSNKSHFEKALAVEDGSDHPTSTPSTQDASVDEEEDVSINEESSTEIESTASLTGNEMDDDESDGETRYTEQNDSDSSEDTSSDDEDYDEKDEDDDIAEEFSLDDMDEEDYSLSSPESDDDDDGDTEKVDHFKDIDDDILEYIGLAESDLK